MSCKCRSIVRSTVKLFLIIVDFLSGLIFKLINWRKPQQISSIEDLILLESATSLAEKIRQQKLKSEDVVKIYINRINEVNELLNAVVDTRYEDVIREAQEIDEFIVSGRKSIEEIAAETPLLGVPFTSKECLSAKGLHHSAGLLVRKNVIATEDAAALTLIKNAGAILLGVTNTPEIAVWWDCYNKVYGRTRNPYVTTRTPGGSSGGQGSIIGAAGSVFGIGSDLAGSIRLPCFFNGIFGHLPTMNMVPVNGHIPKINEPFSDYLSVGPMCRYATDLLPIYKILAKNNLDKMKLDDPVDIKTLKVYYMEDDCGCTVTGSVHPELKSTMQKVITYLKQVHGIQAEKVKIQELFYTFGIWQAKIGQGIDPPIDEILTGGQDALKAAKELAKWCIGCSRYTLPTLMNSFAVKLANKNTDYLSYMNSKFHSLCDNFQELLGDNGIFLYPSHPRPAPYYCQPIFQTMNFLYTAIFNLIGLPVTQCPLGLGTQGLPLGIQVVSSKYNDHLTLAVAVELEKGFGGWVPPCLVSCDLAATYTKNDVENYGPYVDEMIV